jgi:hypothetical protein
MSKHTVVTVPPEVEAQLPPLPGRLAPKQWIGHKGPWGRNLKWTRPDLPGVVVHHCGHPTALYPYYVDGIEQLQGRTWKLLKDAQAAALDPSKANEGVGLRSKAFGGGQ